MKQIYLIRFQRQIQTLFSCHQSSFPRENVKVIPLPNLRHRSLTLLLMASSPLSSMSVVFIFQNVPGAIYIYLLCLSLRNRENEMAKRGLMAERKLDGPRIWRLMEKGKINLESCRYKVFFSEHELGGKLVKKNCFALVGQSFFLISQKSQIYGLHQESIEN